MASIPAPSRHPDRAAFARCPSQRPCMPRHPKLAQATLALFVAGLAIAAIVVAPGLLPAQTATPHITAVTPDSGKSNDSITITGENLGKDKVAAVFLSDAKLDHKAVVVDQEATKIVIKVPDNLKPGDYNISMQEGPAIYIEPVIFTVKT